MPSTLVECVPNFSEGRDKAKVDAIVDAMKIPGVYLLDREMDSDHNRSRHHAGRRARGHSGSRHPRRRQSRRVDRSDQASGSASADGRGRCRAFYPDRRRHHRRLRRHGAPRGRGNLRSAFRSRSIFTKPPQPRPNARTWRTFAAASSKGSAPTSRPIPPASPISASPACIPQRARR